VLASVVGQQDAVIRWLSRRVLSFDGGCCVLAPSFPSFVRALRLLSLAACCRLLSSVVVPLSRGSELRGERLAVVACLLYLLLNCRWKTRRWKTPLEDSLAAAAVPLQAVSAVACCLLSLGVGCHLPLTTYRLPRAVARFVPCGRGCSSVAVSSCVCFLFQFSTVAAWMTTALRTTNDYSLTGKDPIGGKSLYSRHR
jgi:hypothetical protein